LAVHGCVVRHRFVEPGGTFVELVIILGLLVWKGHRGKVPMGPLDVLPGLQALGKVVCLGHALSHEHCIGKNLLLAFGWLEWLAFFDAEFPQHGHEETITLEYRLAIDDIRQSFPIFHSTWLCGQPVFSARGDVAARTRTFALGPRVNLDLLQLLHSFIAVCRHQANTQQQAVGWRPGDLVSLSLLTFRHILAGADKQVFARLGQGGHGDLPHVVGGAANLALGHHCYPWSVCKVDKGQHVGSCRVVSQAPRTIIVGLDENDLAVLSSECRHVLMLPLRH
jgi:hypothetical protein